MMYNNKFISGVLFFLVLFALRCGSGDDDVSDAGGMWKAQTSGTTGILFAITHANGTFIAVGANGKILTGK